MVRRLHVPRLLKVGDPIEEDPNEYALYNLRDQRSATLLLPLVKDQPAEYLAGDGPLLLPVIHE